MLGLTMPEMTALLGGLRSININVGGSNHGVFTENPGTLNTDFFKTILDLGVQWEATSDAEDSFVGKDRTTGETKWTGTRADLIFGSNSVLRAQAEVYASDDAAERFAKTFVKAWTKVMDADRF
jgi:catalase-peroxidase